MEITITGIISISAITGFITGAIIPLFKPLIDWGIEKKRNRDKQRRELIKKCKDIINGVYGFEYEDFISSLEYSSMKKHFDDILIQELEDKTSVVGKVRSLEDKKKTKVIKLFNAIADLERKWKLI